MSVTDLLDTIRQPADIRRLPQERLQELADQLRRETIDAVSTTGGHLGAGLGVVELTVALHYVFDTPRDKLVWDVGHQVYPHKIVTGRRERIRTLRQPGGLSGFTKRAESDYDAFGAGHSSTSISAALGMAAARDLERDAFNVVAVIGDGAMTAGLAYEAMNNAGASKSRLIVILNDNDMSIAPNVGALNNYLSRVVSSSSYRSVRHVAKEITRRFPRPLAQAAARTEEYARGLLTGGTLFEALGFYYVGPLDGHNIEHLVPVLENVRDNCNSGPVLVHVVTEKGRGFGPAQSALDKCHAVNKFDPETGLQQAKKANAPSYTGVFAKALIAEGRADARVIGITAAMPDGTGIAKFQEVFPERTFDVGIAEQHAVTFAAGMATRGYKPFCAIYSTFLQRAYDQVVHDVAIQKLPVRFAIDRAGVVGADGPTHAGSFDLTYLGCLPGFTIMVPSDEAELMHMIATAAAIDDGPSAVRYPRGEGVGVDLPEKGEVLAIGRGRVLREGASVALVGLGPRVHECLQAADRLKQRGINPTVIDARFAKPLDGELLRWAAASHEILLTVEEGATGGFGSAVQQLLLNEGLLDRGGLKLRSLVLPDLFMDQGTPAGMYAEAGLDASGIAQRVLSLLDDVLMDRSTSAAS